MNSLLFILGNFLAVYISITTANLTMRDRQTWRRVLAALSGFSVVVLVTVLVIGVAGRLTAVYAVVFLSVWALAVGALQKYMQKDEGTDVSYSDDQTGSSWYLSVAVLVFLVGVLVERTCFNGINFKWDDLNYHIPGVAYWLVGERLSLAPVGIQSYFPFNSELIGLWFMLPFHSDALVNLCGLYWGIVCVISVIVLCKALGADKSDSLLLGGLLLASLPVVKWATGFAAVNLAGPAMILAAVALVIPSDAETLAKVKITDALYAGLLSGFAVGCKASFIPVPFIILLWLIFKCRQEDMWRICMVFAAGVLATGGFWYIRNLVLTGNPLFPAQVIFFDGPFAPQQQNRTKLISWILAAPADMEQWKFLLTEYLTWPLSLSLLAITGYSATFYSCLKKESRQSIRLLLFIIGITLLVLYPFTPFSGTINSSNANLKVFRRYLIAPFTIGLILYSPLLATKNKWRKLWRLVFVLATAITLYSYLAVYMNTGALLAGSVILLLVLGYRKLNKWMRPAVCFAVLILVLTAISFLAPYSHQLNTDSLYGPRKKRKDLFRFLETMPPGSDVAYFRNIWQLYPLFGRKLHLVPHVLGYQPMHRYWRDMGSFWDDWKNKSGMRRERWGYAAKDPQELLATLAAAGIDYAMVIPTRIKSFNRPEKDMLAASEWAEVVFEDDQATIFKIKEYNE